MVLWQDQAHRGGEEAAAAPERARRLSHQVPLRFVIDHLPLTGTWRGPFHVSWAYGTVGSVSDPNSGVFSLFWIRIRIHGLKRRTKMWNNHLTLHFTDFYNILSFKWLLLIRKSHNHEVIVIFFLQKVLRNSLDPDSDFWLDPDSINKDTKHWR